MRLDRFLTITGAAASRRDAKNLIKNRLVTVNDIKAVSPEQQTDPDNDRVFVKGEQLFYRQYRYFLLNKPKGVISATKDRISDTVLSLIPEADPKSYFPVGRLDIDTEGLLLITNDGAFAHRLTSPKKEVPKTYLAVVSGMVSEDGVKRLESGIEFADFTSKPAKYRFLSGNAESTTCCLTITEGRFHQVKRMFHAVGNEVLSLKRIQIGGLRLPDNLPLGAYREYTSEQLYEAVFQLDETTDKGRPV